MANIYELLNLGIDPRPQFQNLDEVKSAIESKIRKFRQGTSQQAKNELKIKELQEIAAGLTMEKLDAAYTEAKENVKKNIEDALKYVVVNEKIAEEQAERIAKNNKVTVPFIFREFPNVHLKIEEIKELEVPKCKNKLSNQVKNQLLLVKRKNLFDFLNYHGNQNTFAQVKMKEPGELQNIAKTLAGEFDKNPDLEIKSAGTKLAQLCQEIFKDQASKDDYNLYLNKYEPLSAILNKVGGLAENKNLLPQAGEALVAELNKIVRNTDESRRYLRWKCKELGIGWTEVADTSIANCIFCGEKIGVSDEVCGHCGKKQFVVCKKCGKKSRADSRFCTSCSETFGDIKKASEYCDAALSEIRELNFNVARHFISQAEAEGGEADEIGKAKELLERTEKEVGVQIRQLEDCKQRRAYYKANQLLNDIKKMYPGYKNEGLETVLSDALAKAKSLFEKANSASKESECLELCDQIDAVCSDYPGTSDLKDKFPLGEPCKVVVKVDNERKINDILWDYKGVDAGISFTVVRKEYARPANLSDGKTIGIFSARSCSDKEPEAGREYYYAVFANRGSKVSKPGYAESAVINLFHIENVMIRPGDGIIQFQWTNHTNGNVRVWRKENSVPEKPGDGTEVANITSSGVWDGDVENNHSYGYFLCTEYKIGGKILYSDGLSWNHIVPAIPPQPVSYLLSEISETNKQLFHLEWDDIKDTVKFYGSPKPLEWEEGTAIERRQLEAKAALVNVAVVDSGRGSINIGNTDELYVTAVTMGKESCVIGASTYISNRQIFKITETRLVHGDLHIFLNEWPKECGTLKVVYRNDMYPKSMNDKEAEKFICTKSMYHHSKTIVIKNTLQKDYYVSIYGKLGGDKGYAPAVNTIFSNKAKSVISYELVVKKGLAGKIKNVSLEFTNSEGEFQLPRLYVYKNTGFLPPNMSVGEKIKEIEPSAEKMNRHIVELGKDFSKNEYIRVFLKDSQDASFFELNAITDLSI